MFVEIKKNYHVETTKIYRMVYRGKNLIINDFIVVYKNDKICKESYENLKMILKEQK